MRRSTFLALAILLCSLAAARSGDGPFHRPPLKVLECCEPGDVPPPVLCLQVLAPACTTPGEDVEYRIRFENKSPTAAHHVLLSAGLPANAKYISASPEPHVVGKDIQWKLNTVDGCSMCDLKLKLAPAGPGEVKLCVRVSYEHGVCVTTQVAGEGVARPGPTPAVREPGAKGVLRIKKEGPAQAFVGAVLTYQVTVANQGHTPLENVVLVDALPEGLEQASGLAELTYKIGRLAAGENKTVTYQATARKRGRLCNKAVVTADGGFRDEAESCVEVREPQMTLTKTGPKQQYIATPLDYRITVANTGSEAIANVVVVDRLPPQSRFVSASASGQAQGNEVRWSLGFLAPGASRTVEVRLRAMALGEITNPAEATAEGGIRVLAHATTEIVGSSGLLLEVVDLKDPLKVGEEGQYNIIVRNQGTAPATNVRITVQAPPELGINRGTGPTDNRKEGQKLIFEPLSLPAGGSAIYRVHALALRSGDVRFRVELTADQLPAGAVHEEESTNIYLDPNGPPSP